MTQLIRTYTKTIQLPTFIERYRYLRLGGKVGEETFGWERLINQRFYRSSEWQRFRQEIIVRDHGCDLADFDHEFAPGEMIFIHHLNPLRVDDIVNHSDILFDPENVISVRKRTHDAIHFGDESLIMEYEPIKRRPNDICPWLEGSI